MVRKLVLAVAAASTLMSSGMTQALGVGDINLRSALNQPLDAEIELLQVEDLNSSEIRSTLASPDDFGRIGIDRSFFLTDLTFTPVVEPGGKAYIRVTSSRPVREPYLNFLMEVRWPSGRVLREFTLLLDPPLYDPRPVSMAAPVAPPVTAGSGALRTPAAPPVTPAAVPAPRQVAAPAPAGTGRTGEYRTSRDDTLWEIALQVRPEGSSAHQTMLAIQDLNPDAFIGNNINLLKADQTLVLPTAEQAAARSRTDAVAEVNAQTSAWQNRQAPAEPAQRQLDARERSVADAAPAQVSGEDALRLVGGSADSSDETASASGGDGNLRNALDQTREQLDSVEQEKAELADRLADIEGQLETLQRLLTLKDAQLAALQREMGNGATTEQEVATAEAEAPLPAEAVAAVDEQIAATPDEDQQAEPPLTGQTEQTAQAEQTEQAGDEAVEPVADTVAGDSDEEQPALAPTVSQADQGGSGPATPEPGPQPPETPATVAPQAQDDTADPEGMLQGLMQNRNLLLGTGAAALLLLLLVFMAVSRRNARREAEQEEQAPALTPLMADAASGLDDADHDALDNEDAAGIEQALAAVDSLDEQDADSAAEEQHQVQVTPEVAELDELDLDELEDGLAELELPEDEADSRLSGGAAFAPLEEQEQPAAESMEFDLADFGLEEETASSLAASGEEEEIGFDLDFDLDETDALPAADGQDLAGTEQSSLVIEAFDSELPAAEPAADDDFDLSLDEELQADNLLAEFEALGQRADEPTPVDRGEEQAFSLSDDELAAFEAELQSAMQDEGVAEAAELEQPEEAVAVEAVETLEPASASEDLMNDGLDDDFDFLSDTDECATKLDLARAYIDMGDEEGARDILSEVVDEGNEQQQQDAREMMEQLG